jgi:hypothetical protein
VSAEGTKGGDVNRPASVPEVKKLPRTRCALCGLEGVRPMVTDNRCTNLLACTKRRERTKEREARKQ